MEIKQRPLSPCRGDGDNAAKTTAHRKGCSFIRSCSPFLFDIMFKGENLLDTYTTANGGKFTTKEYPCGSDYTIREITPSEGYLLDETIYPVGAEPGNFTLENNSIPMTVTEDVILGSIAITKHTDTRCRNQCGQLAAEAECRQ